MTTLFLQHLLKNSFPWREKVQRFSFGEKIFPIWEGKGEMIACMCVCIEKDDVTVNLPSQGNKRQRAQSK